MTVCAEIALLLSAMRSQFWLFVLIWVAILQGGCTVHFHISEKTYHQPAASQPSEE